MSLLVRHVRVVVADLHVQTSLPYTRYLTTIVLRCFSMLVVHTDEDDSDIPLLSYLLS